MNLTHRIVSLILIMNILISTIGCSVAGYMAGSTYDSKHAELTPVSLESISNKINTGDDIRTISIHGDTLHSKVKQINDKSLLVLLPNNKSLIGSSSERILPYESINSIMVVNKSIAGRSTGFMIGLVFDVLVIALSYYFSGPIILD
ncbi:MAG TPA: hypothetical protein ENH13_00080 [Euryarchaeota archaeon]|nr:hypothetical protein [Euryarchaeota archaeon]